MSIRKHWGEQKSAYLSAPDGSHFALRRKNTFIGSDFANDVVLRFPSISRIHALIRRRWLLGYLIVDLNSSGGTFVNGNLISGYQRIRAGDRIALGTRSFVLKDPSATRRDKQRHFIRIGAWSLASATLLLAALAVLALLKGQDDFAVEPIHREFAANAMMARDAFDTIRFATTSSFAITRIGVTVAPSTGDSVDTRPDKWLMLVASEGRPRTALGIEPWKGKLAAMFRNHQACEKVEARSKDGFCISENDPSWGKRGPDWLVLKPSNEPLVSYSYAQPIPESLWESSDRVDLAGAFTNQDECRQWLASQYAYGSADQCVALDDPRWAQPFVNWKLLKAPALGGRSLPLAEWEIVATARSKAECDAQRYSFTAALCMRSDDPRLTVSPDSTAASP